MYLVFYIKYMRDSIFVICILIKAKHVFLSSSDSNLFFIGAESVWSVYVIPKA